MKPKNRIRLFLVDDDAVFLKLLQIEFTQNADMEIETFSTGELCIENLSHKPDIVILDYFLNSIERDAIDGIQTLDRIKEFNPAIQVIMLSSQDKIDVAVNCMHHNAFDYVVKSETAFMRLKLIITNIIQHQKLEKELSWYMERM